MILETIFTWIGGLVAITFVIFLLVIQFLYIKRYSLDVIIGYKAIFWHLVSKHYLKKQGHNTFSNQSEMKEGTIWYVNHKGKKYTWKCTKVEPHKKTEVRQ